MKRCIKCDIVKPFSDFWRRDSGFRGSCKKCMSTQMYKWRYQNPTYYREWYRQNGRIRNTSQKEIIRLWHKKNPEKIKAEQILKQSIQKGIIQRPKNCFRCNREAKIHGHHPDYSQPLNILWLCASCHKFEHSNIT